MDEGCRKRVLFPPAPGYRFEPDDHELFKFYLLPKVKGLYVHPGIIHDMDAYCCEPSQLPSGLEEGAKYSYFFTPREPKFENGSRTNRCTKDGKGYWRMTSSINEISDVNGFPLGRKNTLVYFQKTKQEKGGIGVKTNWIMHEFTLDKHLLPLSDCPSLDHKVNDIVLCRIYENSEENKRRRKNECECSGQGQFYRDSTLEPLNFRNEDERAIAIETYWSSGESMPSFSEEELEFLQSCFEK